MAIFPYNKQTVAGCKVTEGRLRKADSIQVLRKDKVLGLAKIVSMRREKNIIEEAKSGEDCGVVISPQIEFEKGDIIVSIQK